MYLWLMFKMFQSSNVLNKLFMKDLIIETTVVGAKKSNYNSESLDDVTQNHKQNVVIQVYNTIKQPFCNTYFPFLPVSLSVCHLSQLLLLFLGLFKCTLVMTMSVWVISLVYHNTGRLDYCQWHGANIKPAQMNGITVSILYQL